MIIQRNFLIRLVIVQSFMLAACGGQTVPSETPIPTTIEATLTPIPPTTGPTITPTATPSNWYVLHEDRTPDFESIGWLGNGFAIDDFNQDGFMDFVYSGRTEVQSEFGIPIPLQFLINDGAGNFIDGTSAVIEGAIPASIDFTAGAIADFNGDGLPDAFFGDYGRHDDLNTGAPNILLLSTEDGRLVDASANILGKPCILGSFPASDAPVCGWDAAGRPLYEGDGLSTVLPDMTHSAAAADIDMDGDIDIFVGSIRHLNPHFLINDGSGVFTARWDLIPPLYLRGSHLAPGSVQLIDIDGDTYPDLVGGGGGATYVAGEYGYSHVFWNDGSGDFSSAESTRLPTVEGRTYPTEKKGDPGLERLDVAIGIATADFDTDGDRDIVLSYGYAGRYLQMLLNNGDRSFTDESSARFSGQDTLGFGYGRIFVLDFNQDGAPDLLPVHTNPSRDTEQLWINDGQGFFSLLDFSVLGKSGALFPLDADGDEDLDFLVLNFIDFGQPTQVQDFSLLINIRPLDESVPFAPTPTTIPTLPAPDATPTPGPMASLPSWFVDDFEGSLSPGWIWVREESDQWNLDDAPGSLRIILPAVDPAYYSMLLHPAPSGNFEITTKLIFRPEINFQRSGLIIYQDDDNSVQLVRAYCDLWKCVGNGLYFDLVPSAVDDPIFATAITNDTEVYIRLRREGSSYSAYYSEDGSTWFYQGGYTANLGSLQVGLIAGHSSIPIAAEFEYFKISELP